MDAPLKRKRSLSELSSPPSAFAPAPVPVHLGARTLKRTRDLRPAEHEMHQNALNALFSAQRSGPFTPSPPPSQPLPQPPLPYLPSQPSLHRFWAGLGPPPAPATSACSGALGDAVAVAGPCDDCGAGADGDPDAMEVDGAASALRLCAVCGRHVCFGCSVSNLGEDPRCLRCARGRSAWGVRRSLGGSLAGWVSPPVVAY